MNKMTPNEESHHLLSDEHCPNSSFSERGVLGNRDEHALSLASSPAKFSLDVVYTTHKQMNEITVFVTVNHWDDWLWFNSIIAGRADKYTKKTKDCRGLFKCAYMVIHFSCVRLLAILWTVACQAPLSMGFSRQEHRSGLPFPPGVLSDPGIEPMSLTSPALAGRFFTDEPLV